MRQVQAASVCGPRLESTSHTFEKEFALVKDRHHPASDIDGRRKALGHMLSCIARADRAITSMEVAASCGMPHLRVLNLVGHLKREGVVHASLIAGASLNYYLIHSLSKALIPR